jgi:hypothetical protein
MVCSMQHTVRLWTGVASWIPGLARFSERTTGGTASPLYCYWAWLRHLVLGAEAGISTSPRAVAELGPGDSLGTGIAALLTGADRYRGLDVVEYARRDRDLLILEELIALIAARTAIPEGRFGVPFLTSSAFPAEILTDDRLAAALARERVEAVRAAVRVPGSEERGIVCAYDPAWSGEAFDREPTDLIFSQSVLQNVADLEGAYCAMHDSLREGGHISHEIDFGSHGFARTWDGHWSLSARTWRITRGRRSYAINRQPLSVHLALMEKAGFQTVDVRRVVATPALERRELAPEFRSLTDTDRETRVAFIVARKEPRR